MGPPNSLHQLHLAKDVIFILLPKGSGKTGGGNSISAQAKCRKKKIVLKNLQLILRDE